MVSKTQNYKDFEKEIDIQQFRDSIIDYFSEIPDPRRDDRVVYQIEHIFFIILSAMLAGANSIQQIVIFAQAKAQWINNLIGLTEMPHYGVFWWILVRLRPEFLRKLVRGWLDSLPNKLKDQVLAIDGKCLRGTQKGNKLEPVLHLVSLFAVETGVVIAHHPVEEKSNEITAIPKLLDGMDIQGSVITIDAMGCQKKIAKQICDAEADYVLALKGNAGLIHDEIEGYFKEAGEVGHDYLEHTFHSEEDIG